MSLINQMLQDLEQRRAQATPNGSPLAGLAPSGAVPQQRNVLNKGLLVAVVMLAVATGYLIWRQQSAPLRVAAVPMVAAQVERAFASVSEKLPPSTAHAQAVASPAAVAQQQATPQPTQPVTVVEPEKTVEMKTVAEKPAEEKRIEETPVAETVAATVAATPDEKTPETAEPESLSTEAEEPPAMEKRELPLTQQQRAQQLFQQAVAHLGRGEQADASLSLDKALEIDPTNQRARETLAVVQLNTGRKSESEATLREGLMIDPAAAPLAKLYARFLLERGETNGAADVLERALPNAKADSDYLALLAAVLARAGRHAEAVQVYETVLQQRPNTGPWWMGLALSLESLGNSVEALPAYEQALRNGLDGKVAAYVEGRIKALRNEAPAAKEKR